ncbi:hypothetical protein HAX54_050529, partial [Datura stramonium]|nr:hypothetical protein [Datura stramonium]
SYEVSNVYGAIDCLQSYNVAMIYKNYSPLLELLYHFQSNKIAYGAINCLKAL